MPSQPNGPTLPGPCRCDTPLRYKDTDGVWRCAKCARTVIPPHILTRLTVSRYTGDSDEHR